VQTVLGEQLRPTDHHRKTVDHAAGA